MYIQCTSVMNLYLITLLVYLYSSSSTTAEIIRNPLTDRILHYDKLNYETHEIRTSHEKIRRSVIKSLAYSGRNIFISFYALKRNFTIQLWSDRDLFSYDAKFLVHTENGVIASEYDPKTFYRGRIVGEPSSKVHGHIQNGVFDGEIVKANGEKYHIELAEKYFQDSDELDFHSVIYSIKDVRFTVEGQESSCGVKKDLLNKMEAIQATAKPIQRPHKIRSQIDGKKSAKTLSEYLRSKRNLDKRTSDGQYCQVFIAADHTFLSNIGGGSESRAISEIATVFASVQSIYFESDFNEDGTPDEIVPVLVQTEILSSSSYNGLFQSSNIAVDDYLDRWSQVNQDDFCLALLLAYRDFDGGVLGLAWVAQPPGGSSGGICQERIDLSVGSRSLNTAIVTYLNYGSRQPRSVVSITIAHEFGHNFGSSHDAEGDSRCSPGGSDGNYIMYPRATDGTARNNDEFSPCSNSAILQVLETKSDCFTDSASFCGNQIVEEDEKCDCGSNDETECNMVDRCCVPGECTLRPSSECSATEDCCNPDTCQIRSEGFECREQTECAFMAICDGNSRNCPDLVNRNTSCMNGTRFCENGECEGSVCLTLNVEECQCRNSSELCHVCCQTSEDSCISTFKLTDSLNTNGQYRESGRSCNDYQGYCNDDTPPVCIGVDNEQTLNDLLDIFSLETLNSVLQWLKTYWWVPILVIVGIIILIVLLHLTYRKRKPIKKAARRASLSVRRRSGQEGTDADISNAQTGGVGAGERRGEQRDRNETRESLARLKKFFPTCDSETVQQVLRTCRNEQKTVKQLLVLGFPLKKLPLPRL